MLDHDLQWTTDLGNAYYNQPQDVLSTIQVLRQRAQNAGTLQSTPQEQVSDDQGYIQLAPTNPQYVYVPSYNPWYSYGAPINPYPGFSILGAFGSAIGVGLRYGAPIALGAFLHMPFGWLGWALNWLGSIHLLQSFPLLLPLEFRRPLGRLPWRLSRRKWRQLRRRRLQAVSSHAPRPRVCRKLCRKFEK